MFEILLIYVECIYQDDNIPIGTVRSSLPLCLNKATTISISLNQSIWIKNWLMGFYDELTVVLAHIANEARIPKTVDSFPCAPLFASNQTPLTTQTRSR